MPGLDILVSSKKTTILIECKSTVYEDEKYSLNAVKKIIKEKYIKFRDEFGNNFGNKLLYNSMCT